MSFLKFKPLYKCEGTGKKSVNFIDVLPKHLRIDPKYVPEWVFTNCRTLFKEVTIVPPEEIVSPEENELFETKAAIHEETEEQFLNRVKAKLEEIVFENWRPNIFHVHLHSSGLDSRILSWTIRKLCKKHGDEWLGGIMFISSKWEGERFKEIMQYEGWNKNQYCIVDGHLKDDEYFIPTLLNFKSIWRETNGPTVKFNNVRWYLVDRAQKRGMIPGHIQLWSSQFGNEVFDAAGKEGGAEKIKRVWEKLCLSAVGQCPYKCDEFVEPFANIELAKLVLTSSVQLGEQMRPRLLRVMDERLSEFVRIPKGERQGPIAGWILKQMLENYQTSWYGENVYRIKRFPKLNDLSELWAHYIAASLCEYLLNRGYKIERKNKNRSMNKEEAKQDLFEIKEVLDGLKIKFFLVRGTLLGAIREKAFVQSDGDMDLRMFARDWVPEIVEAFIKKGFRYQVVKRYPDKVAKLKLMKRVPTDLMLEYYYPPEDVYATLSVYHYDRVTVTPAEHFKEDCFIDFLGKKFRIPNKAEDLLKLIYGDNWMVSVEEEIVRKSPPCQSWHKHWKKIDMQKYVEWIEKHPKEI